MKLRVEEAPVASKAQETRHLGNVLMDSFNKPEDHLWQIDAGTGEAEMKSSVKSRSIQLARCLRNAGLKPGDVISVSGVNHLDVHIPFYAAYMNGLPLSGIDPFYKYEEIKVIFQTTRPKLVFCELFNVDEYARVIKDLGLDTRIVTFGSGDRSYADFVHKFDDNAPESEFRVLMGLGRRCSASGMFAAARVVGFYGIVRKRCAGAMQRVRASPNRILNSVGHRVATFDTSKVYAWLISTSGTTGLPKVAAFKHSEILKIIQLGSIIKQEQKVIFLNLSSVQWISAYLATLCMISANHIKVQTSSAYTVEHAIDIINKYKPVVGTSSPLLFNNIMKHKKPCDLTCFQRIIISGFAMSAASLQQLKARMRPDGVVWNLFAQTECVGSVLMPAPSGPPGNCGTALSIIPVQLVDPTTGEVITEANRTGELWTKGPRFTEYYNNPEATAAAFSPDGWFKTGDLLYRDQNGFYFYVERMSSSFRFRNYYVMPLELESVIREHPEVEDVCVVGVPHPEDGKQAVACVQRCPGSTLTEQRIKDIVADKLSFHKHLHGGVILVDDFPRTMSGKIARAKVREFVLDVRNYDSEYPCSGNTKKLISTFQQLSSKNHISYVGRY